MLVYGVNVLKETNPKRIKKVYLSRKEFVNYLKENNIKYEIKDNNFLNNLVKENHQGVVLDIYEYDYYNLDDIKGNFIVILDHIEDPHNFGAIIRTFVAAGVKEIIIPKNRSILVNQTVVKVSCGTIENIKIVMVNNLVDAIKKLQKKGYFVYASDMEGIDYKSVDYNDLKVLVIGSEGSGVSRLVGENSDLKIKIPMSNLAESLNASVAAGILIYEMRD